MAVRHYGTTIAGSYGERLSRIEPALAGSLLLSHDGTGRNRWE